MVHDELTSWGTKTTCDFSEDAPSALLVCAQPDSPGPSDSASKLEHVRMS